MPAKYYFNILYPLQDKVIPLFKDYQLIESEIKWVEPVPSEIIKNYLNAVSIAIVDGKI